MTSRRDPEIGEARGPRGAACANDPELTCGGAPSSTYDYDCYVGCVMMESQAVQDVVLENLRCTYPPSACH